MSSSAVTAEAIVPEQLVTLAEIGTAPNGHRPCASPGGPPATRLCLIGWKLWGCLALVQNIFLRLSLNMQFHELHDPKGLAKDVTNLGRWGNGDVEVGLGKPEELPYVMGLVRQAFEKQMGNAAAEA